MRIKRSSTIMYGALFLTIIILLIINLNMKHNYENKLSLLNKTYNDNLKGLKVYKQLYTDNEKDLISKQNELKATQKEYNNFKETVAMSRKTEQTLSRGSSYNLTEFNTITTDDLNNYIKSKAPSDSPFIGRADIFIKASKKSGLDPKFIFSLASLESGFGKSSIARNKNNYFGIAAYNASPEQSAQQFDGGLESGIVTGAVWISKNYSYNGTITLEKMQYGEKTYCQTSNGNPNPIWITQLLSLMN